MNAPAGIEQKPENDAWLLAHAAVNTWRGACLHQFTRAEQAVTETLIALKTLERGKALPLRPLMGHRYLDMTAAVGEGGPFQTEGAAVLEQLEAFRRHDNLRSDLAHGLSCIALRQNGDWIAIFQRTSINKKVPVQTETVYRRADADRHLSELRRRSAYLSTALTTLRHSLDA